VSTDLVIEVHRGTEQRVEQLPAPNPPVEPVLGREGNAAVDLVAVGGSELMGSTSEAFRGHRRQRVAVLPRGSYTRTGRCDRYVYVGESMLYRLE
jgi:hypothetical protein